MIYIYMCWHLFQFVGEIGDNIYTQALLCICCCVLWCEKVDVHFIFK